MIYEKTILGDWECEENCECLEDEWGKEQNQFCLALGDCGVTKNFIGKEGFHDLEDLTEVIENKDLDTSNEEKGGFF